MEDPAVGQVEALAVGWVVADREAREWEVWALEVLDQAWGAEGPEVPDKEVAAPAALAQEWEAVEARA